MESKDSSTPVVDGASGAHLEAEGEREEKPPLKCYDFFTEWRRCIASYHQFHQYYIHGEFSNCKIEKERMYNCFKWRGTGKEKFLNDLERSLEQEQLNMHTPNPVWELRKSPPKDWTDK